MTSRRAALYFASKPGIQREHVGRVPHRAAGGECLRGVSQPDRLRALTREHDHGLPQLDQRGRRPAEANQNSLLGYFPKFYLNRWRASTTVARAAPDFDSRGPLAYDVSRSSIRVKTSRSVDASGRFVIRKRLRYGTLKLEPGAMSTCFCSSRSETELLIVEVRQVVRLHTNERVHRARIGCTSRKRLDATAFAIARRDS